MQTQNATGSNLATANGYSPNASAGSRASQLIAQHTSRAGIDYAGLQRDVQAVKQSSPSTGMALEINVLSNLSPVQQGAYLRAQDSASAVGFSPSSVLLSPSPYTSGFGNNGAANQCMLPAGFSTSAAATQPTANSNDSGQPDTATLITDITQMTLDITGIVDPTPISDGSNTLISAGRAIGALFRGEFSEAGGHALNGAISVAGILPYVGDLAKAGKFGKWAQTIADVVSAVAHNPALRKQFEPMLRELSGLVNKIPQSVIDKLPASSQEAIGRMKTQLDEFLGAAGQAFNRGIEATAQKLGIDPAKLQGIVDTPKGQRPAPSTYLSADQISNHLKLFDEGAVRFTSRSGVEKYGTLGPDGGFVMPASEFQALMADTGGDLAAVEKRLGLDAGYLSDSDTLVAYIERSDINGLRVPSGKEGGANDHWIPGGYTSGGVPEGVMDFGADVPYSEIEL